MGVTCEPQVIRTRNLGALEIETKMIQRALISYTMPYFVSFNIACAIPDCSDVTTEDVAQIVAQKSSILENIDPQTFLDQLTEAVAAQNPAPEEFSFSFTLDPASSTISDAVTTSVPAGYEFLGKGACLSEYSDGVYDYSSYIERISKGYTVAECATWCDNIAAEPCWVQNQAEKPYLGLSYENSGECYCHFSTSNSTNKYVDPRDVCTLPDDASSSSERGIGPIVFTDCDADALGNDCSEDYSCFKYIG